MRESAIRILAFPTRTGLEGDKKYRSGTLSLYLPVLLFLSSLLYLLFPLHPFPVPEVPSPRSMYGIREAQ